MNDPKYDVYHPHPDFDNTTYMLAITKLGHISTAGLQAEEMVSESPESPLKSLIDEIPPTE